MPLNASIRDKECLLKNVGVMEFNKQHLRLASYAAEFQELVDKLSAQEPTLQDWKHIDALFARISRFVTEHFRLEEEMMLQHGYPGYESQKKQHDDFVKKLIDVQGDVRGRNIHFTSSFCSELWTWLFHHINVIDFAYRDFFISKGLN
ncbi:MAG: hemerythrin family protein [Magnetococcales bacterium]|nr:hemerythrin family protein [Magnetococcales bacterium]MBF0584249.1 hemerythrin family protein [Magnetococcales bacterium]